MQIKFNYANKEDVALRTEWFNIIYCDNVFFTAVFLN